MDNWKDLAENISGDIKIEEAWLEKVQEMYKLFCKKHHDYGRNNIGISGEDGIKVRLADKVSRLFELEGKDPMVQENIRETWIDIAIYGVIALTVLDGDWPRISPRKSWETSKKNHKTFDWLRNKGMMLKR